MQLDCTGYIQEHKVGNKVIVPGATFIEAALRAENSNDASSDSVIRLTKGYVLRPCHVSEGQKSIDLDFLYSSETQSCEISLQREAGQSKVKKIFRADLSRAKAIRPIPFALDSVEFKISGKEIYAYTKKVSIQYGPMFTRLHSVEVTGNRGAGLLKILPKDLTEDFLIHPTMLDAAFHICGPIVYTKNHPDFRPGVPAKIQDLQIDSRITISLDSKVRVECIMHEGLEVGDASLLSDLQIYCDDRLWVVVHGLKLIRVDPLEF